MLLRNDDGNGAIVVLEPDKATMNVPQPALSDEIQNSSSDDEKPDEISDDSSNLEDEVPVAQTKPVCTGRVRRSRKSSEKRSARKEKAAAPRDWLLKYLQPNVSNVEDSNTTRNGCLFVRASTDSARQRKEDPSSDVEEQEVGRGQPEGTSVAQDEGADADDEEELPCTKRREKGDVTVVDCEELIDPVSPRCSFTVFETQEEEISPRKPLDVEPVEVVRKVAQDEGVEEFTDFEEVPCTKSKEKAKVGERQGAVTVDCEALSPRYSFTVFETQEDDVGISPRKPLGENYLRDVEPLKGYSSDKMTPQTKERDNHLRDVEHVKAYLSDKKTPQTKERKQKENEVPRKRKLSLSKDSKRQLSLKSFMKPSPVH